MKSTSAKLSLAALAALGSVSGFVHDLHAAVVINEVYGGGGSTSTNNTAALYSTDYVELYNNGTAAVDLAGLNVKYGSATGTFPVAGTGSNSNIAVLPSFLLAPGEFYLISGASSAGYVGTPLTGIDYQAAFSAASGAGKLGLFAADGTTALDIVAYGSSANGGETASTPTLSITLAAYRTVDGLDTNNNSLDFTVGSAATPGASNVVPEPASLGIAAVGAALALRRRNKAR